MKGRKLPRTETIISHENDALKNKVKCLEDALKEAYKDMNNITRLAISIPEAIAGIERLTKENEKLKKENEKLKKEKTEVEEILQYREEFIETHCA